MALGQAALSIKPYAATRGNIEKSWAAMRDNLMKKCKGTIVPAVGTIRDKFRQISSDFRKRDAKEIAGTGNADEFDEFKRVWTEVVAEVKLWEEEEARDKYVAEKKKKIREENRENGQKISDAIMSSRTERTRVDGDALSLFNQLQADLEVQADSDSDAEELSQGKTEPKITPPKLSFARPRYGCVFICKQPVKKAGKDRYL